VFITSIVRQMAGHGSPASTFFTNDCDTSRVNPESPTVLGEASIVKVEVEGQQGETTLTTRSEPYNETAIHVESGH